MDRDILEKYALALKDAANILTGKIEPDIRKNWSKEERQRWMVRFPKCPLCKRKYSDANLITKEHIHPLCIGGKERGHNITALCEKCNKSRNDMMLSVLAFKNVSELQKRWPANKTSLQEFVIWCHATIFEDISVIREFSHINESFSIARNIDYPGGFEESELDGINKKRVGFGESVKSVAKSFLGAFKPLKKRSVNNSNVDEISEKLKVSCGNCSQNLRIPIDYGGNYKCPKCKFVNNQSERITEAKIKEDNNTSSVVGNNQEVTLIEEKPLPVEKFEEIILQLLPKEPILLTSLASKVNAYMKSNNFDEQNTTAFLQLFGLPRGFKKALITHLESKVRIFTLEGAVKVGNIQSSFPKNKSNIVTNSNENTSAEEESPIAIESKETVKKPEQYSIVKEVVIIENERFNKMALAILSKNISHVLFSTLSHRNIEAGVLGGQINSRLRKEKLIQEEQLFYSLYGLSKKKGLIKLIKSEFSEQITCVVDNSNTNRWYIELKASAHLLSLKKELERIGAENNGVVKLLDFWEIINQYRENHAISRREFQLQLGIPNEGTVQEKVWRLIERLNVPYSLKGFMIEGQTANIILS